MTCFSGSHQLSPHKSHRGLPISDHYLSPSQKHCVFNINGDVAAQLFVQWMPPSMVPMHFLGGEELTEICSKSVRRTYSELHTFLLFQYTSSMAAVVGTSLCLQCNEMIMYIVLISCRHNFVNNAKHRQDIYRIRARGWWYMLLHVLLRDQWSVHVGLQVFQRFLQKLNRDLYSVKPEPSTLPT